MDTEERLGNRRRRRRPPRSYDNYRRLKGSKKTQTPSTRLQVMLVRSDKTERRLVVAIALFTVPSGQDTGG